MSQSSLLVLNTRSAGGTMTAVGSLEAGEGAWLVLCIQMFISGQGQQSQAYITQKAVSQMLSPLSG